MKPELHQFVPTHSLPNTPSLPIPSPSFLFRLSIPRIMNVNLCNGPPPTRLLGNSHAIHRNLVFYFIYIYIYLSIYLSCERTR